MKLSVLIPTYDYKCYTLVADLQRQLDASGICYEILVIDDGGKDQVCAIANLRINEIPNCHFERSNANVGRANNCNKLIGISTGDWCLIIDSDAKVVNDDFIERYLDTVRQHPEMDIIVGDLVNPKHLPSPDVTLRYRYEKNAEPMRRADIRQQHAFERFSTFNILIRKSALEEVPFDKNCVEYGFEDTLMGIEMKNHGKHILHIDNPLMHLGFDPNSVFLRKTETSLKSLKRLEDKLLPHTSLGLFVKRLEKLHLTWAVKLFYRISRPWLRRNLLGNSPNLKVFNFYKVGYFLHL